MPPIAVTYWLSSIGAEESSLQRLASSILTIICLWHRIKPGRHRACLQGKKRENQERGWIASTALPDWPMRSRWTSHGPHQYTRSPEAVSRRRTLAPIESPPPRGTRRPTWSVGLGGIDPVGHGSVAVQLTNDPLGGATETVWCT